MAARAHVDTAPFWKGFGAAMSPSLWEWLWNGDEDVTTPLLFSMGAVSNLAPEDPGPDPEPDEPICWEACEPIQPPFGDW